jgi:hypothetical protein
MFLWEIWSKGLWPFMFYLYQIPFYLFLGTKLEASLFSSLISFFGIGILSFQLFKTSSKSDSLVGPSIFLFFLITSPFYLRFSTLAMTESFGSLMQLIVYVCYLKTLEIKSHKIAVLFSLSLTALFFTKYNYFILVIIPIIINEYLAYTKTWKLAEHFRFLLNILMKALSSVTWIILILYLIFLSVIFKTGGFEFYLFNQAFKVYSIGNTGFLILYFLIIQFLWQKKRNKFNYSQFLKKDFRIKPIINYFVIPLIIWFAIPYPNHIKEFFGLVVNRESTGFNFFNSILFYFNILENEYYSNNIIFFISLLLFLLSIIRYKNQTRVIKFFIVTSLIQIFLVLNHPYKGARFIFTALIPIWAVIALEINLWINKAFKNKLLLSSVSIIFILGGMLFFHNILETNLMKKYVSGFYIESKTLSNCFHELRAELNPGSKLAVIGSSSNILSPSLLEWEFGKPVGFKNYIGIVSADHYDKLNSATNLLIIAPEKDNRDIETLDSYQQHLKKINELTANNRFKLIIENSIKELKVVFRLYKFI